MKTKSILLILLALTLGVQAQVTQTDAVIDVTHHQITSLDNKDIELNPVQNIDIEQYYIFGDSQICLTWDYPEGFEPRERATLSWSGVIRTQSVSYVSPRLQNAAQRFDETDMEQYVGWLVKEMTFCVYQPDITSYALQIWKGTGADDLEVVARVELDAESIMGLDDFEDVEILFEEPIIIESGFEYWFGIEESNGLYAFVMDESPCVPGKGLMMQWYDIDGWSPWNDASAYGFNNLYLFTELENPETGELLTMGQRETGTLKGYNITANGELVKTTIDPYTLYYSHVYGYNIPYTEYCVTAIYEEGESEAECVSIGITAVDETEGFVSAFEVYPNPSDGVVTIRMNEDEMFGYTLLNAQGQTILTRNAVYDTEQLSLSQFAKGVYFLKLNTKDGTETRKVVIR